MEWWEGLHLNISAAATKVYHQHLYLSFSLQLLLTDLPNSSFSSFPVHSISGSQSDLPKVIYIFYHVTSRFESLLGMNLFRMRPGLLSRSFITLNILICAIHYASDQPHVAMEHSKCGQSYLRYAICVKYTHISKTWFKEKNVKHLISNLNIFTRYWNIILIYIGWNETLLILISLTSIFKMWLLENAKLHMWVLLYIHWTMLTVYPTSFICLHC